MIGATRLKVGFGAICAFITFIFSLSNNPFGTTLLRTIYAWVAFTVIAFVVSHLLTLLLNPTSTKQTTNVSDEERGTVLDLVTPDESNELSDLMKERWADSKEEQPVDFQPLQPKRLVSLDNPNPEDVVQTIRRLTDE
ncbi:MAG: hypothetical protein P0Y55_09000 [Candidatus Cohnella colombiensis]|uniref:Uncharacterized protein n=1 Tax=Candidatus Cohnella colombiensis TaxID=3121368 RepID=A0AA95JEJ8_9BACL|nr:MAG: hypothetical protein P0Y55_09000 [Cohnella sp.]